MFYIVGLIVGVSLAFEMGLFFYYDVSNSIKSIFKIENENRIRLILILFLFIMSIHMGSISIYIDSINEFDKYFIFCINSFSIGGIIFTLLFLSKKVGKINIYRRYIKSLSNITILIVFLLYIIR